MSLYWKNYQIITEDGTIVDPNFVPEFDENGVVLPYGVSPYVSETEDWKSFGRYINGHDRVFCPYIPQNIN